MVLYRLYSLNSHNSSNSAEVVTSAEVKAALEKEKRRRGENRMVEKKGREKKR